jgi:hypothetical protein
MQLAPDGKIYLATGNSTRYMHIIHQPDVRGVGCNLEQHALHLDRFNFYSVPNYPNFRLGREVGSACDTLYYTLTATATHSGDFTCQQPTATLSAVGSPAGLHTYQWSNGNTNATTTTSLTGTYTVTITNLPNGYTATSTVLVSSNIEILSPTITAQDGLLSLPVQYVFYQWYFNGQPIIGANAPTYTATLSGDYSVVVRDANGCAGLSEAVNVVVIATTPAPPLKGGEVKVFPNPAQNSITIALPEGVRYSVVITDVLGREVKTVLDYSTNLPIFVGDLKNGLYDVSIFNSTHQLRGRGRVVVQR